MWGPAKMTRQDPPQPVTYHVTGGRGKKGTNPNFSIYSLIKGYFKKLTSHNKSAKLVPSVLKYHILPISFLQAVRRENVSYTYSDPSLLKTPKWPAILSQLHYILQATHVQKAVNTRTKPATTAHMEQ
jgi:hypothetical protein